MLGTKDNKCKKRLLFCRYTYGKPVKGIADVRIRSKWPQYNWINNTRVKVSKDIELQFPVGFLTENLLSYLYFDSY